MTDITKHEWFDSKLAVGIEYCDGKCVGLDAGWEGTIDLTADDALALAEHFGLLPRWMTREEFEANMVGGLVWGFGVNGEAEPLIATPSDGLPALFHYQPFMPGYSTEVDPLDITHVMPINTPETLDMAYYDTPTAPLAEAISAIAGTPPPFWLEGVYKFNDITDEHTQEALQGWCSEHANPVWATGLSMIEGAELIVEMAIENANIDSA